MNFEIMILKFLFIVDQSVIDNIGQNLQVNYIWQEGGWMIKLTNGGAEDIVAGNWTIFFNHASMSHYPRARHQIIEENGLMIQHHDGWLYSLQPVIDPATNFRFRTIKPNESMIVEFKMFLKSKSYAFPRWYVAGGNSQPRVIVSTDSENLDFVIDHKRLMPPPDRFEQNLMEDLGRAVNPVVPSPLKFVKDEKSREITLDSSWRIFFSDDLKNEANYLAGNFLSILTSIRTITKFLSPDIAIVHSSIKLHFSLSPVMSQTKQKTKQNTKQRFLYMNSCPIRRWIIQ